jgi:glucose/mannose-6-phosphate isomerase
MNLDDAAAFRPLDPDNMIAHINTLPKQLMDAWQFGQTLPMIEGEAPRSVVLAGMGSSGAAADVFRAYAAPLCPANLSLHQDYDLPAWAQGPETLVIALSHSGNTEEPLAAFSQAVERGCRLLVISSGGRLAALARQHSAPLWSFPQEGASFVSVGAMFSLLLAAFYRLGLLSDPTDDLFETLHALNNQQTNLLAEVPVAHNPAKRMAGQMMGRISVVFGADDLAPAARFWKAQINNMAKCWAQAETLPEADHNTLAGLNYPERALSQIFALFLESSFNHPRNRQRLDFTRQMMMAQGINTDTIRSKGTCRMAHIWTALHFGDYTAYYLAMACGENPTAEEALTMFKEAMDSISQSESEA